MFFYHSLLYNFIIMFVVVHRPTPLPLYYCYCYVPCIYVFRFLYILLVALSAITYFVSTHYYYYSSVIFHSRTVSTVKNQNKHLHTTIHFVSFFTISPPHPFIHHSQRSSSTVRRDFTTTAVPPLRASPRKTASTHCGLCERPPRSSSCTRHQPTSHQPANTCLNYK